MILLQTSPTITQHLTPDDWSAISAVSQSIIAIVTLLLTGYIFLYQKRKDRADEENSAILHRQNIDHNNQLNDQLIRNSASLNEQNIKLQWFKELIVQPNMMSINSFYENLHTIKGKISNADVPIEEKEGINNFIKGEQANFRKAFVDVLLFIDKNFADQVLKNLDVLIDEITNAIFDDELKLTNPAVYEKAIGSKITYSRNSLLAQLYNYKGLASI